MRLIDADWVLAALGVFNDRKHGDAHFFNGIASAEEIVEHAPTIATRDWTPCAEGLPENSRYVFITLPHSTEAVQAYYLNGEWYNAVNQPISAELVIAWMPKPAPYNPDHIREATKKED